MLDLVLIIARSFRFRPKCPSIIITMSIFHQVHFSPKVIFRFPPKKNNVCILFQIIFKNSFYPELLLLLLFHPGLCYSYSNLHMFEIYLSTCSHLLAIVSGVLRGRQGGNFLGSTFGGQQIVFEAFFFENGFTMIKATKCSINILIYSYSMQSVSISDN